jgi:hypothetical protein
MVMVTDPLVVGIGIVAGEIAVIAAPDSRRQVRMPEVPRRARR